MEKSTTVPKVVEINVENKVMAQMKFSYDHTLEPEGTYETFRMRIGRLYTNKRLTEDAARKLTAYNRHRCAEGRLAIKLREMGEI